MHPSDNSVIRTVKCDIGNKVIGRNTIIKDNFTFGIKELDQPNRDLETYMDRDELEQTDKRCEFWCNLGDPDVRFFAEMEDVSNINEDDLREAYSGASATMTYQNGLVVKFLPTLDVVQTRMDTSRNFKQKEADLVHDINDNSRIETKRVITKNGTIIRYMKNGGIQLLFRNGNYSVFNPKDNTWIKTKNSGERKLYKLNKYTGKVTSVEEIAPLKVENSIDPETNTNVYVRSDGVMIIYYNDKSTLVMHHDNTHILEKENSTETIIEKATFAPVKIRFDIVKYRVKTIIGLGGTNALMGYDDIMERSNNGYLVETFLPDNTLVQSFREKQTLEGYNNFSENTIHLFRRQDFSVLKVKQDGEVVVITSNERALLNDLGYSLDFGKDKDYFFELFGLANERRSGVYTCDIAKGNVKTTDNEGNVFIVYANGESIERLSVSFNLDETDDSLETKRPSSPRNIPDGEYIEEECKFLVPPLAVMDPRLVFIKNDGSGYEFMNDMQLEYFFRVREVDTESIKQKEDIMIGTEKVTLISTLRQVESRKQESLIFRDREIPKNVSPAVQTVCLPTEPIKKLYITDRLVQFDAFNSSDMDKFDDDLERYRAHKQHQEEEKKSLEVDESKLPFRSEEKVMEEMKFFYTILKMQNKKKKHMTEAELKVWNMRSEFTDTEDNDDEDLYSTDEEEQEDQEEIIDIPVDEP